MIPKNDEEFQRWVSNFATVANANLIALGLTSAEVTQLTEYAAQVRAAADVQEQRQEAAKSATTALRLVRAEAYSVAVFRAGAIEVNPGISEDLKTALGIPPRKPRTVTPPVTPTELSVDVLNTTHVLRWDPTGNIRGTRYLIEACGDEPGAAWRTLKVTGRTSFKNFDQPLGVRVNYRVRATRAEMDSAWSPVVVANAAAPAGAGESAAPALRLAA